MSVRRVFRNGDRRLEIHQVERPARFNFNTISTRDILESDVPLIVSKTAEGKTIAVESEVWGVRDAVYEYYPQSNEKEFCIFYGFYFRFAKARSDGRTCMYTFPGLHVGDNYRYSLRWNGKKTTMIHSKIMCLMVQCVQNAVLKLDKDFCPCEKDEIRGQHPRDWDLPAQHVDEEVYHRFKKYMNLRHNPQTEVSFSGTPTGMMHDVSIFEIERIYKGMKKETFVPYWSIEGAYTYGVMYKNPKKDGTARKVFPMSPKVNAFITQQYGKQFWKLPDNVQEVRGCRFVRNKYSYDVKNCDWLMLPYFRRLVRECYPDDEKKLLGPVKYLGQKFELPQFPSGICTFMRYAPMCFTTAYLNLENINSNFQIQGDGVFSSVKLEVDDLEVHTEEPYTINGFFYDHNNLPHYVNGDKRLTTPQVLGVTSLRGEALWKLRREIYTRFLRGKVTVKHFKNELGDMYGNMSDREVLNLIHDNDAHINKICEVLEAYGESERLEVALSFLRKKDYGLYRRACSWEGNPTIGFLG